MKINIRKDRMTKWERWRAMFNRQKPDRVPVWAFCFGFSALHCGLAIADVYTKPAKVIEAVNKTADEFGWQDLPMMVYAAMGAWEFGGDIRMPGGEYAQAPMVTRKPVNAEEDVDKLEVPDIKTAGLVPFMMKTAEMQKDSGVPLIATSIQSPWSLSSSICGPELLAKWTLKKPDLVHKLEQKVLPFSIALLRYWVDTFGPDRLFIWIGGTAAASNQLISPRTFEKFWLPYMKQLYEEAHKLGLKHNFCHICGEQNLNLPYYAQLSFGDPGFLSFGHEVDLGTAARYFPHDVIVGNLEPAIIQTGTEEEVYQASKKVIEKGMDLGPGRFIFAPGCELPPKSPVGNVWAMMQAVSDFGWYD